MRDEVWSTNNNWMDENPRIKNDQKLDTALGAFQGDHDFTKNDDCYYKDNIHNMISQPPHNYYGTYEYHAPSHFYENMFNPMEKEAIPPFQEVGYGNDPAQYCGPDVEQLIKVNYQTIDYGYWHQGLIQNPPDNIQNMLMNHDHFLSRTSPAYKPKDKIVKQQQNTIFVKTDEDNQPRYKKKNYLMRTYEARYPISSSSQDRNHVAKLIGGLTRQERNVKIKLYLEKRKRRTYTKKVSYDCRKKVADQRIRIKGRFVTKSQAIDILNLNGAHDYTSDHLKKLLCHHQKDKKVEKIECPEVKIQ